MTEATPRSSWKREVTLWLGAMAALTLWLVARNAGAMQGVEPAAPTQAASAFAQGSDDQDPEKTMQRLPYVPGQLILKLKDSVDACFDCLLKQHQPLAPAVGSTHLDELNRRFGVKSARPLRQPYARLGTLAERRAAEAGRRAARARSSSAPPQARPDFHSVYVLQLASFLDIEAVAREYASDPAVEYAEPDRKVRVAVNTNDPYLSSSGAWGQPFGDLWGINLIHAPQAWGTARGAGVVVAVTDTGVDAAHPDIAANMWTNAGEIPGNGIDDDGNGYVDDVGGWNFVANTPNFFDDHGHGTHVSGTIAATGNNALGVVGVAWESKIMPLKGLDAGGGGTETALAETILYAAENGANVINASWGGIGQSQL